MRELKFRLIENDIIVGYEKHTRSGSEGLKIFHSILDDDSNEDYEWWNTSDVSKWIRHDDKEQYTGLKDKNGVEIYEGDTVKVYTDRKPKYEDFLQSKYDKRKIESRSIIIFKSLEWRLDTNTEWNTKILQLQGKETVERRLTIRERLSNYDFWTEWNIEHNSHCYWCEIEIIGNNHEEAKVG